MYIIIIIKLEKVMYQSPKGGLWRQSLQSALFLLQKHGGGGGGGQYCHRNVDFAAAELLHVSAVAKVMASLQSVCVRCETWIDA